mgnify:CR=1 FL=1
MIVILKMKEMFTRIESERFKLLYRYNSVFEYVRVKLFTCMQAYGFQCNILIRVLE